MQPNETISDLLTRWHWALPWLMALFLILGVVFAFVAYRLLKPPAEEEAGKKANAQGAEKTGTGDAGGHDAKASFLADMTAIRRAFSRAADFLRSTVQRRSPLYGLPWYLFLGERGGEKSALMQGAGLEALLDGDGSKGSKEPEAGPVRWWFFNKGAVIDVDGTLLEQSGEMLFKDRLFNFILRQLRRYRPLRPADGIILSIPVTILGNGLEDASPGVQEEAVQRAKRIYSRLCLVQQKLGMRLPVYILLTRCESLEGFVPFCNALPAAACDSILGWSNPYTVETVYTPAWTEECCSAIFRRLNEVELELFGHGPVDKANAVFSFPDRLRHCFPVFRLMLDRLFIPSAYHEAFLLRGVYLVGNAESVGRTGKSRAVFIRDLLERKIFSEKALAVPTSRAIRMGGRVAAGLKVAAVLLLLAWGGGMVHGYYALQGDTRKALPVFRHVEQSLTDPRFDILRDESLARGDRLHRVIMRYPGMMHGATEKAVTMFNGLAALRPQNFDSVVFPLSLHWGLRDEMTQAMRVAFDRVILTAVDLGLAMHAERLYEGRILNQGLPEIQGEYPMLEDLPEFVALHDFTRSSHEFSSILDDYNSLNATGNVRAFSRVMRYALNLNRSGRLPVDEAFLEAALQGGQHRQLRFDSFKPGGGTRFGYLSERFGLRLFEFNPVLPALSRVEQSIDTLQSSDAQNIQDSNAVAQVLQSVERARGVLSQPSLAWMSRSPLDLGAGYDGILQMAGADPFIGSKAASGADQNVRMLYGRFLRRLKSYATFSTGRLLEVNKGVPQPCLADTVDNLVASLERLDTLRFMNSTLADDGKAQPGGPTQRLQPDIPTGTYPWWDVALLEEAVSLLAPYDTFMDEGAGSFPPEIRGSVTDVAGARLGQSVMALLVRAQGFRTLGSGFEYRGAEGSLAMEVKNFNQAGPYLVRLLNLFDRLGMAGYHTSLGYFADLQAMRILRQTDQLLVRERLFLPVAGGLSGWNGAASVAPYVYGLTDLAELKTLFDAQATRIQNLAFNYAEPALAYLYQRENPSRVVSDDLVIKWEVILREVDGYQSKRPGNSVQQLRNYLLDGLKTCKATDILSDNATISGTAATDTYFGVRQRTIQKAIDRRSLVLCADDFCRKYEEPAAYFNANLAGYFPFSESTSSATGQADPDVLAAFLDMLDASFQSAARVLDCDGLEAGSASSVRTFLSQMETVREFLGPFGPKQENRVPQLSYQVDFRTLRSSEINANQLISWRLAVGQTELVYPSSTGDSGGLWMSGQNVDLSLQWAKDSPFFPDVGVRSDQAAAPPQPGDNATMSWSYKGPWAMLAFVRANAAGPDELSGTDAPGNAPPGTLMFQVPTRFVGSRQEQQKDALLAAMGTDSQMNRHLVRVFLKMVFQRASKDGKPTAKPVELVFPMRFPDRAPPAGVHALVGEGGG